MNCVRFVWVLMLAFLSLSSPRFTERVQPAAFFPLLGCAYAPIENLASSCARCGDDATEGGARTDGSGGDIEASSDADWGDGATTGDGMGQPGDASTPDGDEGAVGDTSFTGDTTLCGNFELDPGETCDGDCPAACIPPVCATARLVGSADTCDAWCQVELITVCRDGDGCCPTGCTRTTDGDCTPTNCALTCSKNNDCRGCGAGNTVCNTEPGFSCCTSCVGPACPCAN